MITAIDCLEKTWLNKDMDKKPDRSLFFIGGSLGLLFLAVVVTSLINKNQSVNSGDIRAKASVDTGLRYEATISSLEGDGSIKVSSVTPYDNPEKNFGEWTVLPAGTVNMTDITVGTKVILTIDAKTFDVKTHTMQAKAITKK